VTTGLFAKHLVIPSCDGDDCQDVKDLAEQFSKLLDALQQEYKPEGPSEMFWVAQLAECMWKQRRVSRSERGFVLARVGWDRKTSDAPMAAEQIGDEIFILETAQEEIETTGTLSPGTYAAVLSPLHLARTGTLLHACSLEAKNDSSPNEAKLDDQFVTSLEVAKTELQRLVHYLLLQKKVDDHHAAHALPEEGNMDQILRYDRALQKKFDWALQRLLESQQRRRKAQAPASVQVSSDQ
jgi:hypothetical protein